MVQWQKIHLLSRKSESDPWVGKIPRKRNDTPPQYSCLGNPMNRGAWWAAVHRAAKELDTTETRNTNIGAENLEKKEINVYNRITLLYTCN